MSWKKQNLFIPINWSVVSEYFVAKTDDYTTTIQGVTYSAKPLLIYYHKVTASAKLDFLVPHHTMFS